MKKFILTTLAGVSLSSAISPTILNVSASEAENTSYHENIKYQQSLTETEINHLVKELSKSYPSLSDEYLRQGIYKQLRGDYTITPYSQVVYNPNIEKTEAFRALGWQGITVDQMGAFLDTALGIALGGAVGGIAAAIKNRGKHEAKSALRDAMIKYGLVGGIVSDAVLDFALNLTSPGYHVAKYWDRHDRVPNNGRINF
ncbi:hypothetical protein ACEN4P_12065 [Marinilactibacillus psychrotolerans]|uniref:Uncharacterized protein n=2 Tax=Marinilactibacillus psychrotolerans TaxID=191770 RepID=A0A5R9BVZ3_9LACT|nr:hypothetical protein [Marinilactibacillus psychrotolerans]TLQ04876.1 hypothetical protein FEZ48_13110 [Marinilactibacillus psychrotolerans]GEQ33514.1 hypothetical protein B795N_13960 [Marinilactibacillus psychrotolerans]SJN38416.1 hypothetical protein FM115_07835 [Marinilactibacillus psychrotolerans 42ea]